jgi:hypothetical protein
LSIQAITCKRRAKKEKNKKARAKGGKCHAKTIKSIRGQVKHNIDEISANSRNSPVLLLAEIFRTVFLILNPFEYFIHDSYDSQNQPKHRPLETL